MWTCRSEQYSLFCSVVLEKYNDGCALDSHPMAVNRISCASCSGITRIYFNTGAWGSTSCREDAGDLYKEDSHILSALMMGWTTGKKFESKLIVTIRPLIRYVKLLRFMYTTNLAEWFHSGLQSGVGFTVRIDHE